MRVPALHRQHEAGGGRQAALEHPRDAVALLRILQLGILRVTLSGRLASLSDPLARILVGRRRRIRGQWPRLRRDRLEQPLGSAAPPSRCFSSGDQGRRCHIGWPSRRQKSENVQRGSFRPDTICPVRDGASRPAQTCCAGAGSACRRGAAWSARQRRYSTRALRNRRSRRRWARRPWSAARPLLSAPRQPCRPARRAPPSDSSENGLVIRGCSAMRVTRMSKPNSTSAKLAIPEIGAALR